jgi:hypothetical protein
VADKSGPVSFSHFDLQNKMPSPLDLPFELRSRIVSCLKTLVACQAFRRRCVEFERRHWMVYQKKRMVLRLVRGAQTLTPGRAVYRWSYHTARFSIDEIIPAPHFGIEPFYRHRAHSRDDHGCVLYCSNSTRWACAARRPLARHGVCPACRVFTYAAPDGEEGAVGHGQRKITDFFYPLRQVVCS